MAGWGPNFKDRPKLAVECVKQDIGMIKKLPTKLLKNDIDLWQIYLLQVEACFWSKRSLPYR